MKTGLKAIIGAALSCFVLGTGIGYAAVSDTLETEGTVEVYVPDGVFIYDVIIPDGVNAKANAYTETVLNSTVTLGSDGTSTVSFDISLHNNSDYVYTFNGVKYLEEAYDNSNIEFDLTGLEKGDEIAGRQFLNFTITFSYKNASNITDYDLNSVLNFEFVPEAEYIPEIIANNAIGKFEEVLNTEEDFNKLIAQMENTGDRANSSYIGNVVGATTEDTVVLNELFTEGDKTYLVLNIAGQEKYVTAMIKRENLDENTATGDENGNEMTIYMTSDTVTGSLWGTTKVQVFTTTFTKIDGGEWTQLGDMYEGTATTNNYSGSFFGAKNSFNTDTWRSSYTYHGVGANSTLKNILLAYLR
ncbi:MAG: hypothetical protein E7352_05760 [Clostridiales bacterium]|nr:hypothetical protein [Clostridiales bacterium]